MATKTSRRSFLAMSAGLASSGAVAGAAEIVPAEAVRRSRVPHGLALNRVDAAITMAIENIAREGFTDVFPRQFEADLLDDPGFRRRLHDHLRPILLDGTFDNRCVDGVELISLAKRTPFAVRRVAVMSPTDAVLYLALAVMAAPDIEARRIPRERMQVFSYRYRPGAGRVFDETYAYGRFVEHSNARLSDASNGVVVDADIECFYERVTMPRLREALTACSVEEPVIHRIVGLLEHWGKNGRDGGLPIGSNASRILAEAVLVGVDDALLRAGVDFVRFVDDYRLFAPDVETAQRWCGLIANEVEKLGLSLNPAKTEIRRASDPGVAEIGSGTRAFDGLPRRLAQDPKPGRKEKEIKPPPPDYDQVLDHHERRSQGDLRSVDLRSLEVIIFDDAQVKPMAFAGAFMDAALEQADEDAVIAFPRIVSRYPELARRCTSVLLEYADEISPALRARLSNAFAELLANKSDVRDYYRIGIIELLGCHAYANPSALMDFVRQLEGKCDGYLARLAVEGLRAVAGNSEFAELSASFPAFGGWAKRSLLAWAADRELDRVRRDMRADSRDLFGQAVVERSMQAR